MQRTCTEKVPILCPSVQWRISQIFHNRLCTMQEQAKYLIKLALVSIIYFGTNVAVYSRLTLICQSIFSERFAVQVTKDCISPTWLLNLCIWITSQVYHKTCLTNTWPDSILWLTSHIWHKRLALPWLVNQQFQGWVVPFTKDVLCHVMTWNLSSDRQYAHSIARSALPWLNLSMFLSYIS